LDHWCETPSILQQHDLLTTLESLANLESQRFRKHYSLAPLKWLLTHIDHLDRRERPIVHARWQCREAVFVATDIPE
tara:strand:- start:47 stop:277 length:231 start_codon:yes stop_codon:yes gene_type:complete